MASVLLEGGIIMDALDQLFADMRRKGNNADMLDYLKRYKAIVNRINKARRTTDTKQLQVKARQYLGLALKQGYDPIRDIGLYQSL